MWRVASTWGTIHLMDSGHDRCLWVEHVMAYYLERDTTDGPYVRARCHPERDGQIYTELFEIGEPVHLETIPLNSSSYEENQIFWIKAFIEHNSEARCYVALIKGACHGEHGVPLRELVKVPAMLRLALESR